MSRICTNNLFLGLTQAVCVSWKINFWSEESCSIFFVDVIIGICIIDAFSRTMHWHWVVGSWCRFGWIDFHSDFAGLKVQSAVGCSPHPGRQSADLELRWPAAYASKPATSCTAPAEVPPPWPVGCKTKKKVIIRKISWEKQSNTNRPMMLRILVSLWWEIASRSSLTSFNSDSSSFWRSSSTEAWSRWISRSHCSTDLLVLVRWCLRLLSLWPPPPIRPRWLPGPFKLTVTEWWCLGPLSVSVELSDSVLPESMLIRRW